MHKVMGISHVEREGKWRGEAAASQQRALSGSLPRGSEKNGEGEKYLAGNSFYRGRRERWCRARSTCQ
jgi:hypothetical protein